MLKMKEEAYADYMAEKEALHGLREKIFWKEDELKVLREAAMLGLRYEEVADKLPHRTLIAIKNRFLRIKQEMDPD